ncbi:MAG: iron-containing alcohol dehydrogenase [Desulfovibrio sp.]|nr:iron-containing alcohol dehydrogenase [Desulfovibrio sp.]
MESFTFHVPTKFVFGRAAELKAGEEAKALGARKVLVHYGSGSCVRSGLLARIEASLREAGLDAVCLGGVVPNPRLGLIKEGVALARKEKVDLVLAVGGGSVIDSAKGIAAGVLDGGDIWDFYERTRMPEQALPVGCVLTIAAAGSESSWASVVTREDGRKRSLHAECVKPKFALLNPELTFTLPPYQTASGAADMMAHVLERYYSPSAGVDLTDRLCEGILLSILENLPRALKDPADYDARANLMWAGTIAHNNTCGIGRVQDWGSHALEHELSGLYDCAHGAGLAVVFPAWMRYAVEHAGGAARTAQLAVRVFGVDHRAGTESGRALEGIARFKAFLESCGLPTSFKALGAKREDIPRLVDMLEPERRTIGQFLRLDRQTATAVYELCCQD